MKKTIIILLLSLLFYNSVGYYLFFHIEQFIAERELEEYIGAGSIPDQDIKIFKIPVAEYQNYSSDFSRVEGDFESGGKFYEIIKQNLENDTIYIHCLNNEKQEQLLAQLLDHLENNLLSSKSSENSKNQKTFKSLLKEYLPKTTHNAANIALTVTGGALYSFDENSDNSAILTILSPPPEAVI